MSKKALGKGIEALLKLEEGKTGSVEWVDISRLSPGEHQPRKTFSPESLQELTESIRQKGIIQPILVEEAEAGRYRIIAGERRFRAAGMAGLDKVPVLVQSFSPQEKLEVALIENIQREDLGPIEEAAAYKQLMLLAKITQEELAHRLGKSRPAVANALRLLNLSVPMQESLSQGDLTPGHARAILSLINPADQEVLYRRILENGLSVREAEAQAGLMNRGVRSEEKATQKKKVPTSGTQVSELVDMEQRLIESLGTKVHIRGSIRQGKIEISYFSMEDLERIYELLEKK